MPRLPFYRNKSFAEFKDYVLKLQRIQYVLKIVLCSFLSLLIAVWILWLALTLEPENKNSALFLALTAGGVFLWWFWPKKSPHHVKWPFLLDVSNPDLPVSPYDLGKPDHWNQAAPHLHKLLKPWFKEQLKSFRNIAFVIFSLGMIIALSQMYSPSLSRLKLNFDFRLWFPLLKSEDSLTILKGFTSETPPKISFDKSSHPKFELEKTNLVEIALSSGEYRPDKNATIELRELPLSYDKNATTFNLKRNQLGLYQSFQLALNENNSLNTAEKPNQKASLMFSVGSNTVLYIPELYGNSPLAIFTLKILPLPKLSIELASPRKDPWPDHIPLKLKIAVEAFYPLRKVELLIKAGKKQNKELVSDILINDMRVFNSEYELILEPYVINDIENIEIIATATDQAIPAPLTGYSNSIVLNVASAYGRYRNTLQTLREVKSSLDQNIASHKPMLEAQAMESMNKSLEDAEDSPFFDNFDRLRLNELKTALEKQFDRPSMEQLYTISNDLNSFLVEHESLDDRERDRDFFVAARGLARAMEVPENRRNTSIGEITTMMKKFLKDRHSRWQERLARLPQKMIPALWSDKIKNDPFSQSMDEIKHLKEKEDSSTNNEAAMGKLSQSVNDYRAWIEALERQEDLHRAEMEQAKEQALVSAQNEIENIRKLQARISLALDQAKTKDKSKLDSLWPDIRMDQNANIKNTKKLETDLRSFSPAATARLKAATSEMKLTNEKGSEGDYVSSESHADMAGRLLIQAQNAAQRERSRMGQGRQSHKRTTGDNSYGNEIISSQDIETHYGYQVDKMYREEIIEETQKSEGWEENKSFLSDYLRQIVR